MMPSTRAISNTPLSTNLPAEAAHYAILHLTEFEYPSPVHESVMELRMAPLEDARQRLLRYDVALRPAAALFRFREPLGNRVDHFDIPALHRRLSIRVESLVALSPPVPLPARLAADAWSQLEQHRGDHGWWEMRVPSQYAQPTDALRALAAEIGVDRHEDPLTLMRRINHTLFRLFDYAPQSTGVDSPIDEALLARRGVCQDFSHILIALARSVGIPCRYVSGYLFHRADAGDRSAEDATHAWVEAWLPTLGWCGFDPTNDMEVGGRHIRVAVGRDYADVPPTRGVLKGDGNSRMRVGVRVERVDPLPPPDAEPLRDAAMRVMREPDGQGQQ